MPCACRHPMSGWRGSEHLVELWLSLFIAGEWGQMAFTGPFHLKLFYDCSPWQPPCDTSLCLQVRCESNCWPFVLPSPWRRQEVANGMAGLWALECSLTSPTSFSDCRRGGVGACGVSASPPLQVVKVMLCHQAAVMGSNQLCAMLDHSVGVGGNSGGDLVQPVH